ncbi:MAG: hypothetical protein KF900_14055 [Bacteroidetes bacterium]|nr:hypothetical protein [Bacteroidota bacterium]
MSVKIVGKKIEFSGKELDVLQTIMTYLENKDDWRDNERNNLLEAHVLFHKTEIDFNVIKSIYNKVF